VKNLTKSFQVVVAENVNGSLRIRVKNISRKEISAYMLAVGDSGFITVDYSVSGHVIPPGQIEEQTIPLSNPTAEFPELKILGVVFVDHSGEGDGSAVAKIKNIRRGEKSQLERVIPLLKEVLNEPDSNLLAAFDKLKSKFLTLPETASTKGPRAVSDGVYDVKQEQLKLIEKLERRRSLKGLSADELRQELSDAVKQMEERLARL
jgi:hypothetical protein